MAKEDVGEKRRKVGLEPDPERLGIYRQLVKSKRQKRMGMIG